MYSLDNDNGGRKRHDNILEILKKQKWKTEEQTMQYDRI